MIDINDYFILKNHLTTLEQTSKDNSNGKVIYMTNSKKTAVNFDDVKKDYIINLGLSSTPCSNDAFLVDSDGSATFIEFKNGVIDKKEVFAIRKKIYDSVLILSDIISKNISFTREELDYMLVYNEAKNPDEKSAYNPSDSRDFIDEKLLGYGKKKLIKYGLEMFEGYCFKNVYTYTEKQFENRFR